MEAGTCVGVTGTGDCVGTGWTPYYLLDATLLGYVDTYALVATTDIGGGVLEFTETVCPYCLLDRADAAGIPGFSPPKYASIKAKLDGLNCFAGTAQPGHTHLFNFVSEDIWPARKDNPAPGERGF